MNGSINFDGTLSGSIAGGGGGGGSEVTITPVLTEGTKIADYSIDGTAGELYAPEAGDTVEVTPTLNVGDKVADIEVNGVNKALYSQSYGYANDIYDVNSETIGGLQKGSNITPVKVRAVSYADQSGTGGETIGVLSVGDTDYTIKQKKANIIDSNEKVIGTWFNETCYEKTINITVVPPYSTIDLSSLNIKDVVGFSGIAKASNSDTIPLGYSIATDSQYLMPAFEKATSTLYISMGSGLSDYSNVYITIQYTKVVE